METKTVLKSATDTNKQTNKIKEDVSHSSDDEIDTAQWILFYTIAQV